MDIFYKNILNIKFRENPSSGSRVFPVQTDGHEAHTRFLHSFVVALNDLIQCKNGTADLYHKTIFSDCSENYSKALL
jgi:hypothetical protein